MLEFKLNTYFEMYKNSVVISSPKFKEAFIKKHGEFELLNELVIMIQKYQYKTYGDLLATGKVIKRNVKTGTYTKKHYERMKWRFGTKAEREIRKKKWSEENEKI